MVARRRRAPRRGIALPMVLLVLLALNLVAALALSDGVQATRTAAFAEERVRLRAAAIAAVAGLAAPPDLAWLCLQPPSVSADSTAQVQGVRVTYRWWSVAPGAVRVQLEAAGAGGARHRRLGWMRPDSLLPLDPRPGCPDARRLRPVGEGWLGPDPEG